MLCTMLKHLCIATGLLLAACTSTPKSKPVVDMPLEQTRTIKVFDGSDGSLVARADLVAHAAASDVVILGENHGHPVGLPWAAALWEDVSSATKSPALSLEFFERDEQSRLDDYLKSVTTEDVFKKRTDRKAGNYPASHRLMVERAKSLGRPVVASNASWNLIRYLRGKQFDALASLTPEQQRLFRVPDSLIEGRYRTDFDKVMAPMVATRHAAPGSKEKKPEMTDEEKKAALDSAYRTQQLWDWTMADSIARAADAGSQPVFHVIGRFHSDFWGGTPQALSRIRPGTRTLTISVVDETSDTLRDQDKGRADYVVYVGPAPNDSR